MPAFHLFLINRVGLIICCWGRVRSAIFALGFGFENYPLKSQIFQFVPIWVKKISSGWVKKYPDQRRVGLFFTAGKKYAWVGSGPISTCMG